MFEASQENWNRSSSQAPSHSAYTRLSIEMCTEGFKATPDLDGIGESIKPYVILIS